MTTEERNKIVEDNIDLVDCVLKKKMDMDTSHPKYDDYKQEASIALMKAVETYVPGKLSFPAYANQVISTHILRYHIKEIANGHLHWRDAFLYNKYLKTVSSGCDIDDIDIHAFCEACDVVESDMVNIISTMNPVYLDEGIDGLTVKDGIADSISLSDSVISDIIAHQCMNIAIEAANAFKSNRRQNIWIDYFFASIYGGVREKTQMYLGKKYHVNQRTVSVTILKGRREFAKRLKIHHI